MNARILLTALVLLWGGVACVKAPAPWQPDGASADGVQADAGTTDLASGDTLVPEDRTGGETLADGESPEDGESPADGTGEDGVDPQECADCKAGTVCVAGYCVPESDPCTDGNEIPWDGCTDGWVSEFLVNQYTLDDQRQPAVAALAGGGFVVVWHSCPWDEWEGAVEEHDGWGCGIFARVYGADGIPGDEFVVNDVVMANQLLPAVAPWKAGFVVAWLDYSEEELQVRLRAFGADGAPFSDGVAGAALMHTQEWRPALAVEGDTVLAVWHGHRPGGGLGILGQFFELDNDLGTWEPGELLDLKTVLTADVGTSPDVAALPGSEFVVVWDAYPDALAEWEIYYRQLTPTEAVAGDEELLHEPNHEYAQDAPAIAAFPSTEFPSYAVAYMDNEQHFENEAAPVTQTFVLPGTPDSSMVSLDFSGPGAAMPDVDVWADWARVVVWQTDYDWDEEPNRDAIMARAADGDGQTGPKLQLSLYGTDFQKFPQVAVLAGGDAVVVWESCPWDQYMENLDLPGQDGDGCGVFARRFTQGELLPE